MFSGLMHIFSMATSGYKLDPAVVGYSGRNWGISCAAHLDVGHSCGVRQYCE